MKIRAPKTGDVFERIENAYEAFDYKLIDCDSCSLGVSRCNHDWVTTHPLEAARRMGYEVIDEEATMEKMDKPRICEVLGVEVGETFTADTPYGEFKRCVIDDEGQILNTGTNVLCYIINHPDRIIRKPRFTEEEVAFAQYFEKCYPGAVFLMDKQGFLQYCYTIKTDRITYHNNGYLPNRLFKSIKPGQSIALSDI